MMMMKMMTQMAIAREPSLMMTLDFTPHRNLALRRSCLVFLKVLVLRWLRP